MQLSIEVLASQVDAFINAYQKSDFKDSLNKNDLTILIPHVNGKPYTTVINASNELIENGFTVMPHLGVRNLNTEDNLDHINQFLNTQTKSVLLLGGDNNKPQRFESVLQFLKEQWENNNAIPVDKIAFAVFPEGHPHIEAEEGISILNEKIKWAAQQGVNCGGFSQICLEAQPIIQQNTVFDNQHINFAISFVAPCKIPQLLKLTAISGVKNAMSFVKKHNVYKMLSTYDSDSLIQEMKQANIKPNGLHCYAFGNYAGALKKLASYSANL
jgi:methylenetetrahydrofolate reductase (NADPH)